MSATSRLFLKSIIEQQFIAAGDGFFVDNTNGPTNINPQPSSTNDITRINIFTQTGLTAGDINTENYYFMTEASNYFTDRVGAPAAVGNWSLRITFRDSGLSAIDNPVVSGSTDGGNLLTNVQTIPSGTQYIDVLWKLIPLFPIFLSGVNFSDRYRRIAALPVTASPNGHTTNGARPQVTI